MNKRAAWITLGVCLALLAAVVARGFYVVRKDRAEYAKDNPPAPTPATYCHSADRDAARICQDECWQGRGASCARAGTYHEQHNNPRGAVYYWQLGCRRGDRDSCALLGEAQGSRSAPP